MVISRHLCAPAWGPGGCPHPLEPMYGPATPLALCPLPTPVSLPLPSTAQHCLQPHPAIILNVLQLALLADTQVQEVLPFHL